MQTGHPRIVKREDGEPPLLCLLWCNPCAGGGLCWERSKEGNSQGSSGQRRAFIRTEVFSGVNCCCEMCTVTSLALPDSVLTSSVELPLFLRFGVTGFLRRTQKRGQVDSTRKWTLSTWTQEPEDRETVGNWLPGGVASMRISVVPWSSWWGCKSECIWPWILGVGL